MFANKKLMNYITYLIFLFLTQMTTPIKSMSLNIYKNEIAFLCSITEQFLSAK